MPKMFFGNDKCLGATSGTTGQRYDADRNGFIHVENPSDIATLKSGGYIVAGGMPKLKSYWLCTTCGWEASINSCPKCKTCDLQRVHK